MPNTHTIHQETVSRTLSNTPEEITNGDNKIKPENSQEPYGDISETYRKIIEGLYPNDTSDLLKDPNEGTSEQKNHKPL